MKSKMNRATLATLLLAMLLGAGVGSMLTSPVTAEDKGTPIDEEMNIIASGQKKLRRQIKDASKNEDSIKLLLEMQIATIKSKQFKPKSTEKVPSAEQAKYLADYHKGMNELLAELVKIEEALVSGDQAAAEASYEKLANIKKTGHDKFVPEQ